MNFTFQAHPQKPLLIAGPCMAESYDLIASVCSKMKKIAADLGYDYVFKASFDKANRTAIDSDRGPGIETCMKWFAKLKQEHHVPILTDVHEVWQIAPVAEVCDVLQIPAFLCRQTDLIIAAVESGRAVNVKKGQFLAPEGTHQIVKKMNHVAKKRGLTPNFALTERGVTFGYGNLIVDMRGLPIMAATGAPVIFDVTHSLQRPAMSAGGKVTDGDRSMAPVLTRAAAASGYLSGFFMEVHDQPAEAKSDAQTQLTPEQAHLLLKSAHALWREGRQWVANDTHFTV